MIGLRLTPAHHARYLAVSAEAREAGPRPDPSPPRRRIAGRPPAAARPRLSAADLRFAELIFEAFDVMEVVGATDAARIAGEPPGTARDRIARLKANKCWPYRDARWRPAGGRGEAPAAEGGAA